MSQSRIVLCMKWGTVFPADYVNVLYTACRAGLTGPFRFVCLTDDAAGLLPGVEALPIPDIGLTAAEWRAPGVWPKLALYLPDLHGLRGRCLFVDLDMIVLGGLDDMFDFGGGDLVSTDMGEGWRPGGRAGARPETGTCIFAFDLGRESQILSAFLADKAGAMRDYANEQDFVGAHARAPGFWPEGWVISFKRHLRRPVGADLFLPPRAPPPGTRVVAFHGTPRPMDLVPERAGFWDRFPHMGHGQVGWVRDYWVGHGGRMPPFGKEA